MIDKENKTTMFNKKNLHICYTDFIEQILKSYRR